MISYCMAIKDRADQLAVTLPLTLANMEKGDELNIIDYGSRDGDGLAAVLNDADDRVNVSRYETIHWRVSHAKNLAHRMASLRIVCNLDADNWVGPGFSLMLKKLVDGDRVGRPIPRADRRAGGDGRIAMTQEVFGMLGGYDERMERWGYDATDIKARAEKAGFTLMDIDVDEFIDHDNSLRDSGGLSAYNARFFKNNIITGVINPNGDQYGRGNLVPLL